MNIEFFFGVYLAPSGVFSANITRDSSMESHRSVTPQAHRDIDMRTQYSGHGNQAPVCMRGRMIGN